MENKKHYIEVIAIPNGELPQEILEKVNAFQKRFRLTKEENRYYLENPDDYTEESYLCCAMCGRLEDLQQYYQKIHLVDEYANDGGWLVKG